MGATKTATFSAQQLEMSELFKALGHPARWAIIEHLMQVKACVCGDLLEVLPLAQPTVSQHLKALKQAGLIQGTIEGTSVCYCLNPETVGLIQIFASNLGAAVAFQGKSCC
jgi:ArsR family transcriptional regulator